MRPVGHGETAARMTAAQAEDAAAVLARAFFDDPLWRWIEPDDARRPSSLRWLMAVSVRYAHLFGEAYVTDGVRGAALWHPPGAADEDPDGTRTGYADAAEQMGAAALARFELMVAYQGDLQARDMPKPHWGVSWIGVDPGARRRGAGSALMAPVLRRADEDGVPCYLETENVVNLPFYRKNGFEVLREDEVPEGGPRFWTLARLPRA
jgi:GNAT superfamily N-acetyltransferase